MSKRSAQRNRWRNRPKKHNKTNLIFGGMDLEVVSRVFTTFSIDHNLLYKEVGEVFAKPMFDIDNLIVYGRINTEKFMSEMHRLKEDNAFVCGNKPRYDGSDIRVIEPLQIEEVPDSVL